MKRAIPLMLCVFVLGMPMLARAAMGCGDLQNAYGPFDYRIASKAQKSLVEGAHFTSDVQMLIRGNAGYLAGDIDYTLRAFPNNPKALLAIYKLGLREKTDKPVHATYSIECYFDRAFRLAPDDPMPRLIYGMYLKDRNRREDALQQLELAASMKKESTTYDFPYNLALTYLDLGQFDKAVEYAKQAYELGAPLPGLRNKLVAAGKWTEPTPVPQ